jgi:anti-sigma regulatory factor (Ser/Thr protein kinase)
MTESLQLTGEASLTTIAGFVAEVERACAKAGADTESCYAVKLAVEEVCLNVLKHGYGGVPGPIGLAFTGDDQRLTVTITDSAPPFSPENAPPPDLDSGWDARRIGGFGWHLVQSMMDSVEHRTTPTGGNEVTLIRSQRKPQ